MTTTDPLTDEELATIRGAVERAELLDPESFPLAFGDRKRLLAEVDRLRAQAVRHVDCNAEAWAEAARVARDLRADRDQARAELAALPDLDTIRRIEKERGSWGMQLSEARRERDAALARVAHLEELKCAVCGMRVAHLNHGGHVIGWGCADGEQCAVPAPVAAAERPSGSDADTGEGTAVPEPHARPEEAQTDEC